MNEKYVEIQRLLSLIKSTAAPTANFITSYLTEKLDKESTDKQIILALQIIEQFIKEIRDLHDTMVAQDS